MIDQQPLLFNPLDPNFRIDPYPVYRRLLKEAPVYEMPFGGPAFSRYDDVIAILRDPRSSSNEENSEQYKQWVAEHGDPSEGYATGRPFLFLDPPDHTRLRGLVNKAFTPRTIEQLRPRVAEIVEELLDRVEANGSLEVIEDLAYPLPVRVICELMGVPAEDHETFRGWSRDLARGLDPQELLPPEEVERRQATISQFVEYFTALIESRRKELRDDLLSALIAAEEAGDKLSPEELLSTCILILVAGHETTVNLIGNGTLALLRNPDQLERLRGDPSLIKSGVEEVLRYDPPVQFTARIALEDMKIGGATIRKGQQSILLLAAANRDPAAFPDPERFDIARENNHHLAFSFGAHYCVGAPLARIEGELALGALVRRFDNLSLLVEQPPYKENVVLRGLAELPVGYRKVAAAV